MATLTFLKYDKVIQVDAPQVEVTIQDLINQIRDYEDEPDNMDIEKIADAYGKQPLGTNEFIGITLVLVNNWRIAFEARPGPETVTCYVRGGNLVAENIYDNNPIKPTAFTQVVIAQSSSPTIIKADSDYGALFLIESLRGRHASLGNIFYWNPISGNDSNSGVSPQAAVKTFNKAQSLTSAGNHDIIFAISSDPSGITTVTTPITITTPTLKLRGPGFPFQFVPTTSGNPTIQIAADGVELSGFYITTATGGTDNGIEVSGDNVLIKDCWIKNATGNGINITNASRTQIDTCAIEDCSGVGINIGNSTSLSTIKKCIITGNSGGVSLSGTSINDNIFENNLIYNNSGVGINIGTGVLRTGIRLHHT
ncbi:MAG: right-handed parallel beta-helix repeat-containing protein, partial [Fervidobacterium sp.]